MAKLDCTLHGNFDAVLQTLEQAVLWMQREGKAAFVQLAERHFAGFGQVEAPDARGERSLVEPCSVAVRADGDL